MSVSSGNNAKFFDELKVEGKQLHTAIRYGLSRALLDATALASNRLKAEVVCDEWHLPVVAEPIPLFGQSGDDRYNAVDKMILKHVDVLPHGLINNVDENWAVRVKNCALMLSGWPNVSLNYVQKTLTNRLCTSTFTAPSV